MLKVNEKKLYKFIFILVCCLFFIPGVVLAEEPEQGDIIIQTDGTYSDHEVIEACEVGSMVKLDIGSFDTAYINNNFDFNANIDGYVYFECGAYNDIKLAYYGINQTIFSDDISSLTDEQINVLKTLNYDSNLYIALQSGGSIDYVTNITSINTSNGSLSYNGYNRILADGNIREYTAIGTEGYLQANKTVFYLRFNGETIYNGLPIDITGLYNFDDVASVYYTFIYDSYFSKLLSFVSNGFNITSSYPGRIYGGMECKEGDDYSARCNYYQFNGEYEGDGSVITNNYMEYDLPGISLSGGSGYYDSTDIYTGHFEILITFNDDYKGYLEFENIGKFYINGNELRFNYRLNNTMNGTPSDNLTLNIISYALKRKIDPIVNPVEDEQKESVSKNDTQNAELDSVITEYNEIEGQFKDNLDTSLNDINFTFDFGNITDFSTSANFVRSQFDNLTNNPFGSLVGFSLAVGLALLIMGRRL